MNLYTYLLKIQVPSVSLREIPIKNPKDLKVEIESPLAKLTFTSSRLNLLNCSETTATFEANINTIKDKLKSNPLKVTVKLQDEVVGIGEIPWPKKFVDGIAENMEVITDGANTELKMNDKVVGCLEVIIRLQGCCHECNLEKEEKNLEDVNNDIDPGDILFLMDDGDACKQTEPEVVEDSCKGRLNLANYQESNGKIIFSPEFHEACTSPQCIALKQMGGNFEKVVKSLICSGVQDVRANKKLTCCNPCEVTLDPCTGQYVCAPQNPTCCVSPKDKVTAPCGVKSNQPECCTPQICVQEPSCASSPPCYGSKPKENINTCSSPSYKCVSCIQCTPNPRPAYVSSCLICKKHEYVPNEWPNFSAVDCRCKSITPKQTKSSKCCRICEELLENCVNTNHMKAGRIQCRHTCVPVPKYCRICNSDISWLPKHFSCPTCGDKQKSCLQQEYEKTLKMIRKLMKSDHPKC